MSKLMVAALAVLCSVGAARADVVVETHGIELSVPDGWGQVKKGALTIYAPKKYKGRALEVAKLATVPAATAAAVAKLFGADAAITQVREVDGQIVAQGTLKGANVDTVIVKLADGSGVIVSAYTTADSDPAVREANAKVLRSVRLGGPRITVEVTAAKTGTGIPTAVVAGLQALAPALDKMLVLPRPLKIVVGDCGQINAFYSPAKHAILMCHELYDSLVELFVGAKLERAAAEKRATGTMMFTFFHEFGHALVGELALPITGKGEDAADEVATLIVGAANVKAQQWALDAAMWFEVMAAAKTKNNFWDTHSFDKQRSHAIACLLYGANQKQYLSLMQHLKAPKARMDRCVRDYKARHTAWNQLLAPHYRKRK